MGYELVVPPVSEAEEEFCHARLGPETPVGYYLAKGVEKFGSWLPAGGFAYNERPTVRARARDTREIAHRILQDAMEGRPPQ